MAKFKFKQVQDSSVEELDTVEFLDANEASAEEVAAWVETYIVPSLTAISDDPITVTVLDGEITITGVEETAVADSALSLSKKSLNFKNTMKRILDDDAYGDDEVPEVETPLPIVEDIPEENTEEWLEQFAAPSIQAFLSEHGVEADVEVSESGEVKITPVNLEDIDQVETIMDSYKHKSLGNQTLKVKDDEEDIVPTEDDDEEEEPNEEVTAEGWADAVAIPAIQAHLEEEGIDADFTVELKNGSLVITADMDEGADKDDDDDDDIEEITDSAIANLTRHAGLKAARVVFNRVSDSRKITKYIL